MRVRNFLHRVAQRFSSKSGETIVESLVGMLIVTLAFAMLCGAVVTAARVNTAIHAESASFVENTSDDTSVSGASVSVKYGDKTTAVAANGYESKQGGYVYYEAK